MGFPVYYLILLSLLLFLSSVQTQELQDQDALCNENSCLVIYFQRKIFLDAWRSCRKQGGNLVTIKSPEEADLIETLFSNLELESSRVFVWIGLQRQPRKCAAGRPMRGFSWITGEQDAQYTNWQQEDSINTCSVPRCVGIGYSTSPQKSQDNFKWKDGPCSIPVDGYLCRYTFSGMCQAISNEGHGNALYTTPFHLVTSLLTHIPFGSVATVPCLTTGDQTVLCTQREDGTVGWNRDPPFCSDIFKTSWCDKDNGGCHHYCIVDDNHYYCDCKEGFLLAEDGVSCFQTDPCRGSPCEYECLTVMDSYRCACPEGYMLAPDEQGCLDVDECLQSPCEQICVNAPGSFECHCRDGYKLDEEGTCEDIDECAESPCEHDCENIIGSYVCHCHYGFASHPGNPNQCYDVDECQIEGTCEQMCLNSFGGFECFCEEGYDLQTDLYSCRPSDEQQSSTVPASILLITDLAKHMEEYQDPDYYKPHENESLEWLTELPNVEMVPTDLMWLTSATQEVTETTSPTESPTIIVNMELDNLDQQTVAVDAFLSSTTSTPLSEYYEDESTTEFTVPPTTTVAGGAWKWMWFSPSPNELDKEGTAQSSFTTDTEYETHGTDLDNGSHDYESTTSYTELQTLTQALLSAQGAKNGSSNEQTQGSSWLLVGLLVPLCIFIVLMVALGIIYCTRCTSKPQNKNATECYHWIAGAGDKAAADMASGGVTKV
ncbi:CD248 molecule, endosialin a [Pangasianodon hypophthalmus]|uniref:CD248 molecule, endosialin a n=1 Tax=Pangasianodon hypophthalmus TaxID=310915 RepID=UPI0023079B7E|nr:CD248 molecule, endosialin a [Pangasianodon hypophthalmus]